MLILIDFVFCHVSKQYEVTASWYKCNLLGIPYSQYSCIILSLSSPFTCTHVHINVQGANLSPDDLVVTLDDDIERVMVLLVAINSNKTNP